MNRQPTFIGICIAASITIAVFGFAASNNIKVVAIAAAVPLYFIPALVARRRAHRQFPAILALNLLLGWTFIGWAIALVWALTRPAKLAS